MKIATAALNVPTFITLHSYGYKNAYELKPLLDRNTKRILFAGIQESTRKGAQQVGQTESKVVGCHQ